MAKSNYYYGLGRRKEATATAHLSNGKGIITVNGVPVEEYFGTDALIARLKQPIAAVGNDDKYDVSLKVVGGGKSGQADAAKLAIAKAITNLSEELRPTLKKAGLLMRDSRVKERKKPGLKRARKAPQFTKR